MSEEEFEGMDERERGSGLADLFKKAIVTGASAVFLTEDAIRNLSNDFKLPKEMINGIVSSAKNTKAEIVEKVGSELNRQLKKIDLKKEMVSFLETHDVDLQVKMSFQKKEEKKDSSQD